LKIVTIIGARPQFIKSALVSEKIYTLDKFDEIIIHTGQHFDKNMSTIFFNQMDLPIPKYNLDINNMENGLMVKQMINKIEPILKLEKPDGILVYGDTNSTLAGSLAASKLNLSIFHIEAGLRSYNKCMQEELNRILTDYLSTILFCPTKNAVKNLKNEGITTGVVYSGDVMYDAYLKFSMRTKDSKADLIENNSIYALATIHRQENTDSKDRLTSIFENLNKLNNKLKIVMPLHPRTKEKMKRYNIKTNIKILPPIGYLDMISLLNRSKFVITDSGGLQKEAFFAKKKCIILREETEWTELVDINANYLSSPKNLLNVYETMSSNNCDFSYKLFGDGKASERIVDSIKEYFN
tara:strand:+ start:99405 stop:100463 length:1059 start_codon:yes stop_codon:yes gene_type:complete